MVEEILRNIIECTPAALFCKDVKDEYRFVFWNRAAEELWGLKSEQVLGKNDYDFFPKAESDFFRKKDEEVMRSNRPLLIPEEKITLGNGEVLYLRTKKVPIQGRYLLGISENITEQKILQSKMVHSSKMSSLGEMASTIAHEINNPLAVIQAKAGYLKTYIESNQWDGAKIIEDLEKIEMTCDHIAKIVRGLRSFSRQSEKDPMQRVKMSQIVEDTLELCRQKFAKQAIDLRVECDFGIELECRQPQISQILMNLLSNAYDAVENLAEKWVEIKASQKESRVILTVTDSGRGIPSEIASRLMQPFFTTKDIGQGTGLGLSISAQIAEEHHGDLWYDSSSQNTRFVLELPIKQATL